MWTRPGQGVHLRAPPGWPVPATTEEFALEEGELKLDALLGHHGCPALRVVLLTTDTSGLKSMWFARNVGMLACRKELLWVSSPTVY